MIFVDRSWVELGFKNVTLSEPDSFFLVSSSISADGSASTNLVSGKRFKALSTSVPVPQPVSSQTAGFAFTALIKLMVS